MDTVALRTSLERIVDEGQRALARLPSTTDTVHVKAGGDLQAALDAGGIITTEDGATFPGCYIARVPGTRLIGPRSSIAGGTGGAALTIPPGARDIHATLEQATSGWGDSVVMVGAGDASQTRLEDVPRGIRLSVFVPRHRGKRAFQINGADVALVDCGCADVYDINRRDSQGVLIWNTPGPVLVSGGTYEAASENILVGGARTAIPGVVPSTLIFEDLDLPKRLEWMEKDAQGEFLVPTKCSWELKAGVDVVFRRSRVRGCFVSGQTGNALVLTPRDGKRIADVLIEDVDVRAVGTIANMISHDDEDYSPATRGVTFRRVKGVADLRFGVGRFIQFGGEFDDLLIDDCDFSGPDNTIYTYASTVWDSPDVERVGYMSRNVRLLNSRLACNKYGVMLVSELDGKVGARAFGANWQAAWPGGQISGNTFIGDTAHGMRRNLPADNVYLPA